jgi:hypothetical protein
MPPDPKVVGDAIENQRVPASPLTDQRFTAGFREQLIGLERGGDAEESCPVGRSRARDLSQYNVDYERLSRFDFGIS